MAPSIIIFLAIHTIHSFTYIYVFSSVQSLNLPDRDPTGFAVGPDGLAVISTNLDIILARDGAKVSSLPAPYEPVSVTYHPTLPEVAIGGKVCSLT